MQVSTGVGAVGKVLAPPLAMASTSGSAPQLFPPHAAYPRRCLLRREHTLHRNQRWDCGEEKRSSTHDWSGVD